MELENHEEEVMEIEPVIRTHPLISPLNKNPSPVIKNRLHLHYKECLKNHAVAVGLHALDGCGEFMPAGPHGSLHALKCAACNCHRNFHRKDIIIIRHDVDDGGDFQLVLSNRPPHRMQCISYWHAPTTGYVPQRRTVALPSGGDGGGGRKRVRTKFTEEQKEKMLVMAEKLEWRIQKKDEAAVMEFCNEMGVKRRVLKIWMHNNKNMFRKESQPN